MSHKKRNGGFSVQCELKVLNIFTSLDKASSAEENDAMIIQFGWVILILWPFLEIRSFSNFAGFLGRMSEEFCRDRQSIHRPVEAHCSVFLLLPRINGLPQKHRMGGLSRHNSPLIRRKNPAKFENDRISRNGHRIKITQPNWMIKASFSSAEDAPSNDVKIYNTFSSQCTENPPFRFLWDRYIYQNYLLAWRCDHGICN